MWGQAKYKQALDKAGGIIPTRVGTRRFSFLTFRFCEDHPHACGDKFLFANLATLIIGSSPRVWGQGICCYIVSAMFGIIPTRVGTSYKISVRRQDKKDHPHACGDKSF